ncbi:hypothetical protein DFH27DRAFT_536488 [Peziza echinospora]|nr:hypothetical protein DFH27DRAFT_536488 [Peziza echinospora]
MYPETQLLTLFLLLFTLATGTRRDGTGKHWDRFRWTVALNWAAFSFCGVGALTISEA